MRIQAASEYSEAITAALQHIMPPGVPPLVLFTTLARNERVFSRVMAGGLLDRGSIAMRDRELVIDRTTWRCGAEYEWGVHITFYGARVKLTPEEISAICSETITVFSPREQLLLCMCDELHATSTLGNELWEKLAAEWSSEQLIELVVLAGFYHLISFATNAFALPLEPFAARLPRG
jgi:alkylhydroperoxidase family enzyme